MPVQFSSNCGIRIAHLLCKHHLSFFSASRFEITIPKTMSTSPMIVYTPQGSFVMTIPAITPITFMEFVIMQVAMAADRFERLIL